MPPATSWTAAGAPVTIGLGDHLDAQEVARAVALLRAAAPAAEVVVDFGAVRHVEWFALAGLACALEEQPAGRVTLRGVCDHHLRVLRYLDARLADRWGASPPREGEATPRERAIERARPSREARA